MAACTAADIIVIRRWRLYVLLFGLWSLFPIPYSYSLSMPIMSYWSSKHICRILSIYTLASMNIAGELYFGILCSEPLQISFDSRCAFLTSWLLPWKDENSFIERPIRWQSTFLQKEYSKQILYSFEIHTFRTHAFGKINNLHTSCHNWLPVNIWGWNNSLIFNTPSPWSWHL